MLNLPSASRLLGLKGLTQMATMAQAECAVARCTAWPTCRAASRALATAASTAAPKGEGILGSIMFVPAIVSAGLAAWQYERMRWKEELLDRKQQLLHGTPVDAMGESQLDDFQSVCAEGHYLHSKSAYVGPRTKSIEGRTQQGYLVVTPFYSRERKKAILVNRGWVPAEWLHNPSFRLPRQPQGRVKVTGVVQPSEKPSRFVPDNQPNQGMYFWLDAQTMAEVLGLPPDTPLVQVVTDEAQAEMQEQLTSTNPFTATQRMARLGGSPTAMEYPMPKTRGELLNFSVMPEDHRNYVLVWGSLSASVGYMALRFVRQGR